MITFYGNPVSGNAHKVLNFLNILDIPFENRLVDVGAGEHKHVDFLALNPLGQIPVLTDGKLVLRDSSAILTYLAREYDSSKQWLPANAHQQALVQQWLSVSVNEIRHGPAMIRAIELFGMPDDNGPVIEKTDKLFNELFEPHLSGNEWLVGSAPTIADIACYSYIARVTDGDYNLEPFVAMRNWLFRVESINGFSPMLTGKELGLS